MKYIGAHVDSIPTLSVAPRQAAMLGATAFALNLVDPSRWKSPALSQSDADAFKAECAVCGFGPQQILPHAGFVINLGSPDARKLKLSQLALIDEMDRARRLGLTMINFHPGAHLKQISENDSLARVSESLNKILAATEGVVAVIENTAGQGSSLGYSFAQIGRIIAGVDDKSRVGVCVDTAHAFAAGYDLAASDSYDAVWQEFDSEIGFPYLRGMHINDSLRQLGSRVDRHASIGQGFIGEDFFRRLMADSRFDSIPLILETPSPELWQQEVATLRAWSLEATDL